MLNGGARPGAGRRRKIPEEQGPPMPPRKRGRPSKADLAARAEAAAKWAAEQSSAPAPSVEAPAAPALVLPPHKPLGYTPEMPADVSPKDYFLTLMRDPKVSPERRDRAAQVAITYTEVKPGEGKKGKKEQRLEEAQGVATGGGAFSSGRPPLAAVK